jgi:hypothetical protein
MIGKLTAVFLLAGAVPAGAVVTTLPSAPFSWGSFGSGLSISSIRVRQYVAPAGVGGGLVQTALQSVDQPGATSGYRCNGGQRCAPAGSLSLQYALWQGSTAATGPVTRVGAVLFGGFEPLAGNSASYSFLQIYSDASAPGGTIDGGVNTGKVNGQIPRYVGNPAVPALGWNYGGTAFDFFDVPYDIVGSSPPENVRFETALVRVGASVDILADWTWSFSTLAPTLGGQSISFQGAPSAALLSLYAGRYPTTNYVNAIATVDRVPEPASWVLMIVGFGTLGTAQRAIRRETRPA